MDRNLIDANLQVELNSKLEGKKSISMNVWLIGDSFDNNINIDIDLNKAEKLAKEILRIIEDDRKETEFFKNRSDIIMGIFD